MIFGHSPLGAEDTVQCIDTAGACCHIEDAGSIRDTCIAFRSHGGGLLMMRADVVETRGTDGVVEVHGTATGDQKNVTRAPLLQPAEYVIR